MFDIRYTKKTIEELWNKKNSSSSSDFANSSIPSCVLDVMDALDIGKIGVVEKVVLEDGVSIYIVNDYVKKAILLYFRYAQSSIMPFGDAVCFDKVPLKTASWTARDFISAGFRVAPGAIIRYSAFIASSAVVMQSFVNVGASVGEGTMLDTYSLVGSCAQVGKHCHISAGAILGGVLEPLQSTPVIVEDGCFIGAGSSVTEGVIVEEGAVIASGVHLTASTRIVDKASGEFCRGRVPAGAVIVPGTYQAGNMNLSCAVIIKKRGVCEHWDKVAVNELLRD